MRCDGCGEKINPETSGYIVIDEYLDPKEVGDKNTLHPTGNTLYACSWSCAVEAADDMADDSSEAEGAAV